MLAEKIELVEFISPERFAEIISENSVETDNGFFITDYSQSPYMLLFKYCQGSIAHYKAYAKVLYEEEIKKGRDPEWVKWSLESFGRSCFGKHFTENSENEFADVYIRRGEIVLELKIEDRYSIKNGAIYEKGSQASRMICSHLILPIGIYKDTDKGIEQVQIAYNHDGEWHSQIMPREKIYNSSGMMDTAKYGIGVNSKTAGKLCEFLQITEQINRKELPVMSVSDHLGWNEDYTLFVPYTKESYYTNEGNYFKEFQSIQNQKGTLDDWISLMRPFRNYDCIRERIAMAAAFASVLIKPSSASPFMLDIWGRSGVGKTTILMAAASIWGDPRMPGGYIGTFNATDVAKEQLAMFCCDLPVFLDEMQVIQERQDFDTIVYKLCEGKPRGRATSTGALREQGTWHNTILVTGEQPIVNANSMGGAQRRVVNLKCDESLFSADKTVISKLRTNLKNCYGSAGRKFIEMLLIPENMQRALELLEENKSLFAKYADGAQNLPGALILTADALSAEWIYRDYITLSLEEIAEYLKSDQDIDSSARAHEHVMQWIVKNQNHIMPLKKGTTPFTAIPYGRYVRRDGQLTCAILPSEFAKLMKDGGFSEEAYTEWAAKKGKISTDGKHHRANVKFKLEQGEKQIRCVCVYVKDENDAADGE